MTIEERAEEYAKRKSGCQPWQYASSAYRSYKQIYIDVATEQKSIDEEDYTEEMRKLNEGWKENLAIQRYLFTEKACKWLTKELKKLAMDKIDDNFLDNEFKVVLKSDIPKWIKNFRKVLEDK